MKPLCRDESDVPSLLDPFLPEFPLRLDSSCHLWCGVSFCRIFGLVLTHYILVFYIVKSARKGGALETNSFKMSVREVFT